MSIDVNDDEAEAETDVALADLVVADAADEVDGFSAVSPSRFSDDSPVVEVSSFAVGVSCCFALKRRSRNELSNSNVCGKR